MIQNFVSIFNNAPRVVASVKQVMDGLVNRVGSFKASKVVLENSGTRQKAFIIKNIQESRTMGEQTLPYLESVLKEAFTYTVARNDQGLTFRISLKRDGTLEVHGSDGIELEPLMKLLASTREFFSLSKQALKILKDKELVFTTGAGKKLSGGTYYAYDPKEVKLTVENVVKKEGDKPLVVIENKMIEFRGLNPKKVGQVGGGGNQGAAVEAKPALKENEILTEYDDGTMVVANKNDLLQRLMYEKAKFMPVKDGIEYALKTLNGTDFCILRMSGNPYKVFIVNNYQEILRDGNDQILGILTRTKKVFKFVDEPENVFEDAVKIRTSYNDRDVPIEEARNVTFENYVDKSVSKKRITQLELRQIVGELPTTYSDKLEVNIEIRVQRESNNKTSLIFFRFYGEKYPFKVVRVMGLSENYLYNAGGKEFIVETGGRSNSPSTSIGNTISILDN